MAFLDHDQNHNSPSTETQPNAAKTLGALAPSLPEPRPPKPPAKPEPWRPATAGRIALRPDKAVLLAVQHFCIDQGITQTRFFELSALEFIKKHDQTKTLLGAQAPQIDRLITREEERLSSICTIWTYWVTAHNNQVPHHRAPWKPRFTDRDRHTAELISEIDLDVIEIGILTVLGNWEKTAPRINSLNFFYAGICDAAINAKVMTDRARHEYLLHIATAVASRYRVPIRPR